MAADINIAKVLSDVEHLDKDVLRASLEESLKNLDESVEKEKSRRVCCEFCNRAKAILSNNGNGKGIQEIVDLIVELGAVFQSGKE